MGYSSSKNKRDFWTVSVMEKREVILPHGTVLLGVRHTVRC